MQFFALQLHADENRQNLAELVIRKVEELGERCKTLELLDVLSLGSLRYARFRIDFSALAVASLATTIHESTGRNVIAPGGVGGYLCRMAGGKTGMVPYATMQVAAREHPRVYRGNAIVHWERQFLKEARNGR